MALTVELHIYYAFYDGKEENKQKKKLKYNCVISYDGFGTESCKDIDLIEDINFRIAKEANGFPVSFSEDEKGRL